MRWLLFGLHNWWMNKNRTLHTILEAIKNNCSFLCLFDFLFASYSLLLLHHHFLFICLPLFAILLLTSISTADEDTQKTLKSNMIIQLINWSDLQMRFFLGAEQKTSQFVWKFKLRNLLQKSAYSAKAGIEVSLSDL